MLLVIGWGAAWTMWENKRPDFMVACGAPRAKPGCETKILRTNFAPIVKNQFTAKMF
jgi:hypothetical protein